MGGVLAMVNDERSCVRCCTGLEIRRGRRRRREGGSGG